MRKSEKFIGGLVIALMVMRLFFYYPILDKIIVILTMLLSIVYFGLSFALLIKIITKITSLIKKPTANNV